MVHDHGWVRFGGKEYVPCTVPRYYSRRSRFPTIRTISVNILCEFGNWRPKENRELTLWIVDVWFWSSDDWKPQQLIILLYLTFNFSVFHSCVVEKVLQGLHSEFNLRSSPKWLHGQLWNVCFHLWKGKYLCLYIIDSHFVATPSQWGMLKCQCWVCYWKYVGPT